jgi:hypothetical protein
VRLESEETSEKLKTSPKGGQSDPSDTACCSHHRNQASHTAKIMVVAGVQLGRGLWAADFDRSSLSLRFSASSDRFIPLSVSIRPLISDASTRSGASSTNGGASGRSAAVCRELHCADLVDERPAADLPGKITARQTGIGNTPAPRASMSMMHASSQMAPKSDNQRPIDAFVLHQSAIYRASFVRAVFIQNLPHLGSQGLAPVGLVQQLNARVQPPLMHD